MKKKLTIILPFLLMIALIIIGANSEKVYADIKSDIDGQIPSGGGGSSGGQASYYDLAMSTIIKINLVDVSGSYPKETSSFYYVYCNNCDFDNKSSGTYSADNYLMYLGYQNEIGSYQVCGSIGTNGSYSFDCESLKTKHIETGNWFLNVVDGITQPGLNIDASGIRNRFGNVSNYVDVINKLKVRDIIGRNLTTNDITGDGLNTEQKLILKKYRVVVEPVYAFGRNDKYTFATLKGIAKRMIDLGVTGQNLSVNMEVFPYQVYASKQHGTINPSSFSLGTSGFYSTGYNYYNAIANINSGYGYGIFHIVGGCDPSYECCYDDGGNFHEDYFGDTNNYKCDGNVGSRKCPAEELKQCISEPEEITPQECLEETKNTPGELNCSSGETYYEVKNVTINNFEPQVTNNDKWQNYIKSQTGNYKNSGNCDSNITVTVSGEASIEQSGNIGFTLTPTTRYAGGGFEFSISYASNAKYSICNPGLKFAASRQYASYSCGAEPENADEPYEFTILDDGEEYEYDGYYDLITINTYSNPTLSGNNCYYKETKTEIYLTIKQIDIDEDNIYSYLTNRKSDIEKKIKEDGEYCLNNWLDDEDYEDNKYIIDNKYNCIRIDLKKLEKEIISSEDNIIYPEDFDGPLHIEEDDPLYIEDEDNGNKTCFVINKEDGETYCYNIKPEQITEGTINDNATESCNSQSATLNCSGECLNSGTSSGINVEDEIKQIYQYMKDEYIKNPDLNNNASVTSYDSNIVGTTLKSMEGSWEEKFDGYDTLEDANIDVWYPGQTIEYSAKYNLSKACIGLYPDLDNNVKSPVIYSVNDMCQKTSTQEYLDGGYEYYIPLKQPDKSQFPVNASTIGSSGLSIISEMKWDLDYSCSVKVEQRLYEDNGKYKFIYRPINLSNPFPNRIEGSNWTQIKNNTNVFKEKITNGRKETELEYQITLTPQNIISLKNNYSKSYNDLSTISKNGKSTILNDFSFNKRTNTYNELGICTNECW